jgi:hypothetical protein
MRTLISWLFRSCVSVEAAEEASESRSASVEAGKVWEVERPRRQRTMNSTDLRKDKHSQAVKQL